MIDAAACLVETEDVPVHAAVGGQALGDFLTDVDVLAGHGGALVGVDQRDRHLVHVTERVPVRPQIERAVYQREQHENHDRGSCHAAAPETLYLRTECESSEHESVPPGEDAVVVQVVNGRVGAQRVGHSDDDGAVLGDDSEPFDR
ncbi:Uncharacterised protein [Mycobacteroides abscessus subsp. massiliense]|nr:Uncharacterised protein [Mycobacteroides abscessus subsp. massiliense]